MLGPEFDLLKTCIPNDTAKPATAQSMVRETCDAGIRSILDFGCGGGDAIDFFRDALPGASYCGVDIEVSPEVRARTRRDVEFDTYAGETLPYPDRSFDLVYSRQVFEHVRHPDRATQEIRRVLRPGGLFVGSLSNLEPYHSFSIFNYTPYGAYRLLADNGFDVLALRPGPEGTNLIVRQLTMRRIGWFGVIYPAIRLAAIARGWDARRQNYLKLRFSGHICFAARVK